MPKLKCPKCKRTFTHQAWLEKHQAICGRPAAGPSPRAKALVERMKADREEKGPEEPKDERKEKELLVVPDDSPLPVHQKVLDILELEEQRLTKELGQIKSLLRAVRDAAPKEEEPAA